MSAYLREKVCPRERTKRPHRRGEEITSNILSRHGKNDIEERSFAIVTVANVSEKDYPLSGL